MNRRTVLKLGMVAAVQAAMGVGTAIGSTAASAATSSRWLGHKPGYIYLGMSCGGDFSAALAQTGPIGLHRTFYRWAEGTRETRNIQSDHAARRLSWISFKPPFTTAGGWAAVASGSYDADIRARARRYAQLTAPVIVTFNHEPHNDATGTPAEFARAWCRIHDVMQSETGLQNVVSVPILGEWEYRKRGGNPDAFISPAVLDRCAFLGLDLYQNASGQGYAERLGRVLSWLDARGRSDKMVGLGETGATNAFGSPTGAEWWTRSWRWAAEHTDRVGAISYYNSNRNTSRSNWSFAESAAKLAAYCASLDTATSCGL